MIEVDIANKIRIKKVPDIIKEELISFLKVPNPKYEAALTQGYSTWKIDKHIYHFTIFPDGIEIPRGCTTKLFSMLNGMEFKVFDYRKKFEPFHIDSSRIMYRPYQHGPMMDLITKADEGILVAPAGSGKTVMGLSLIPLLGQPTLWLTHTDRLAKQVVERLNEFLPSIEKDDIGVIGGGKWKIGKMFTVGMVQTLVRRMPSIYDIRDSFGLIILDEAHHCPASTFLKVINQFSPYYLYGLTATPYRGDKLENIMIQALGQVTARIEPKKVEKHGGIIVPIVKYRTIRGKQIDGSNTNSIIKHHIISNEKRNNIIVGDVIREATAGNYCVVVSDRKAHCETLNELISLTWDRTGIATGDYSKPYVDEQVRRFYDNEITVLITTFGLLGEGFDVDFLNRGFITCPFRSAGKVEQLVGRIQRSAEGKEDAIIYDYVDLDIGVIKDQFCSLNRSKSSRCKKYEELGMIIEPCE